MVLCAPIGTRAIEGIGAYSPRALIHQRKSLDLPRTMVINDIDTQQLHVFLAERPIRSAFVVRRTSLQ